MFWKSKYVQYVHYHREQSSSQHFHDRKVRNRTIKIFITFETQTFTNLTHTISTIIEENKSIVI
uniref:Ovule protein n=1 Tax=Meloidogyne incognita TaxID=6306 RepID=A0A914L5X2_MELIC